MRQEDGRPATPEPSQGTSGISPIVHDEQACPWRHRPASVRAVRPPRPPGPSAVGRPKGAWGLQAEDWARGGAWPFISSAVSGKPHSSSEPQFPHWQEADDSSSLTWLLWG